MLSLSELVKTANHLGIAIPGFNVPHLPMLEPIARAVKDQGSFALIEIAQVEWQLDPEVTPPAVAAELRRAADPEHLRLHLDHLPAVGEDGAQVDYLAVVRQALELGFNSMMIDGSCLPLEENIAVTCEVVALAHAAGVPVEAELGALRRPTTEMFSYEEFFKSGEGFTKVEEARRFALETGCDWLSVSVGSYHGAISAALKDTKKTEARLNLDLLGELHAATGLPLVLHGGSGVRQEDVLAGVKRGITKINIGSENRQVYDLTLKETGSTAAAQEAVYHRTVSLIRDFFGISGSLQKLTFFETQRLGITTR
jgi:ketose-bisphosphate aldolase